MGRPPARVASGKRGLRHDVGDADVVEDVSGSRNVRCSQDVILCPQTLPILEENGSACVHCPSTSLAMPTFSAWLISSSSAKSSPGTEASRLAAAPVQCVNPPPGHFRLSLGPQAAPGKLQPPRWASAPPGGLRPLPGFSSGLQPHLGGGFQPDQDSAAGSPHPAPPHSTPNIRTQITALHDKVKFMDSRWPCGVL